MDNSNSDNEAVKNDEAVKTDSGIGSQPLSAPFDFSKKIEDKITRILQKIEARKKARL